MIVIDFISGIISVLCKLVIRGRKDERSSQILNFLQKTFEYCLRKNIPKLSKNIFEVIYNNYLPLKTEFDTFFTTNPQLIWAPIEHLTNDNYYVISILNDLLVHPNASNIIQFIDINVLMKILTTTFEEYQRETYYKSSEERSLILTLGLIGNLLKISPTSSFSPEIIISIYQTLFGMNVIVFGDCPFNIKNTYIYVLFLLFNELNPAIIEEKVPLPFFQECLSILPSAQKFIISTTLSVFSNLLTQYSSYGDYHQSPYFGQLLFETLQEIYETNEKLSEEDKPKLENLLKSFQ